MSLFRVYTVTSLKILFLSNKYQCYFLHHYISLILKNIPQSMNPRDICFPILTQLAWKFELMEIENAKSNPLSNFKVLRLLHHFLTYNSIFLRITQSIFIYSITLEKNLKTIYSYLKWLYRGGLTKKGGLGQFADLSGAWQERGGGVFEGGNVFFFSIFCLMLISNIN